MTAETARQCFLVEWYQPDLTTSSPASTTARLVESITASSRDSTGPVDLLLALAAPADSVLYAAFHARSAGAVLRACADAGMPVDRITAGIRLHVELHSDPDPTESTSSPPS